MPNLRAKVKWGLKQQRLNQTSLLAYSEFANLDNGQLSRLLLTGNLSPKQMKQLCDLIGCAEHALRNFSLKAFMVNPKGVDLDWATLVAQALPRGLVERDDRLPTPDHRGGAQFRGMKLDGRPMRQTDKDRPKFAPDTPIKVIVPVQVDDVSTARWPILVFGYDKKTIDNWIPRYSELDGMGASQMPEEGYLILPQRPRILKIDANASDEHGVVTIAHKHGFDSDIIRGLTEEGTSEEQAIQLGQLASWLGSKDPDSYRVFRQDYMVE